MSKELINIPTPPLAPDLCEKMQNLIQDLYPGRPGGIKLMDDGFPKRSPVLSINGLTYNFDHRGLDGITQSKDTDDTIERKPSIAFVTSINGVRRACISDPRLRMVGKDTSGGISVVHNDLSISPLLVFNVDTGEVDLVSPSQLKLHKQFQETNLDKVLPWCIFDANTDTAGVIEPEDSRIVRVFDPPYTSRNSSFRYIILPTQKKGKDVFSLYPTSGVSRPTVMLDKDTILVDDTGNPVAIYVPATYGEEEGHTITLS